MKNDGTVRAAQGCRGLNALFKSQSGGLGDIVTSLDEMGGSTCFMCLDFASGFLQLQIREQYRHLTIFRDTECKLCEYVLCRFRLKTVQSAFTGYVGYKPMPVQSKG